MKTTIGKWNIGVGLWVRAAFMLYGFYLIYARDFAPDKAVWIANDTISPHFESRLAHVHGNLFAFLNIAFGYLLLRLPVGGTQAKWISGLALTGLLMPIGILTEVYLGFPPYLVLLGATAIVIAAAWLGLAVMRLRIGPGVELEEHPLRT
jgi:hypothetical protein